ncbi:MAG TPA: ATPase, T2SS/T4P/T4SS family [Candidatus Saccharimonadales bacterium]|nr:ATPase, T2SS/T4P/T4SS family [Candidatus Saccharimonadales bacterium]
MSDNARLDEEQATLRRARVLGMNYIDTSRIEPKTLYHDLLSVQELYDLKVIPLRLEKGSILFGITTTTSQQTMAGLTQRFADFRVDFAIISDVGYRDYMRLYDPPKEVVYQDIDIASSAGDQVAEVSEMLEQVRADDMLAYLVTQAHNLNASDIHIETQKDDVRIRFRIDGVLHRVANLGMDKYRVLVSAIASAGNVSTSANEAQQGHIAQSVTMADNRQVDVNVRLETVPTINGMDIVMRLFNMDRSRYNLDVLGLSETERSVVDSIISKPSGLVMVVGPTGSGKTTTLYSMLNSLVTDERKIITIEDPVEFQFPGVTQISVTSSEGGNDDSFANKLRAVLRLDPDIVMVGEIRDMDTAKTALQAALTGHLVLATFHASSASASLTRLADIIGQNPLFISAIRLIMAQRLIRKLDDAIKQPYTPSEVELNIVKAVLDTLPANVPRPNIDGIQLYKPGSSAENPYGYKGQLAVREQMTMTDSLRNLLERPSSKLSAQTIELEAMKDGMLNMLQDGILKVIAGQTSFDELFRVLG